MSRQKTEQSQPTTHNPHSRPLNCVPPRLPSMATPGLKTIIALSFVRSRPPQPPVAILQSSNRPPLPYREQSHTNPSQILAIGFLLVILSSALWKNYLPLLVVATYVLAPIPNWLCGRASNPDDFMDSGSNGIAELGRFMTGFLVVMGVGTFI